MNFRELSQQWLADIHARKVKASTAINVAGEISRYLYPRIGDQHIDDITPKMLVDLLLQIASESTYLAKRLCQRLDAIYVYAGVMGYTDTNPAHKLSGFLPRHRESHQPYLSDDKDLSRLLRRADKVPRISPAVKAAFFTLVYTATRRSEVCLAQRNEFDLKAGVWKIPADRTKTGNAQTVVLSKQVIKLLSAEFERIESPWAFTSPHVAGGLKPINSWAPYYLIVKLRYQGDQCLHGFRHIFSTRAHEHGWNSDAVELCLGHAIPGVKGVYNHAQMLRQRREVMDWWASHIDALRSAKI